MPHEIADSDDEDSDIIVHNHKTCQKSPSVTRSAEVPEYFDPTQNLSDLSSSTHGCTSSTKRLMQGPHEAAYDGSNDSVLPSSVVPLSNKTKRAFSDTQRLVAHVTDGHKDAKRSKTYGSRTRDIGFHLFADVQPTLEEPLMAARSKDVLVETSSMQIPDTAARQPVARERDRPRRVVSLLQQNLTNPYHQVTTSMSSMGGYQSINLDFRGDGRGLDLNTNPFGSISQVSVEAAPDLSDHPNATTTTQKRQLSDLFLELAQPNAPSQMMTSPPCPASPIRPVVEPLSEGEIGDPAMREPVAHSFDLRQVDQPSERRKADRPPFDAAKSPFEGNIRRTTALSAGCASVASELQLANKRGRTSKANDTPDVDPEQLQTPMGPPSVDSRPEIRPSAAILEVSSQNSHISQPPHNMKRKRKHSKPDVERASEEPKQYASSELELSDELLIGLPKENYQPRPSRSRSKQSYEGGQTLQLDAMPTKEPDLTAADSDRIDTPAPRSSTGRGKKSKVKRAKTSAAALLKPSEPMLSDGEDDVMWVDSKPAAVKLDLPPDIRSLKKEQGTLDDESTDELHFEKGLPKRAAFSLEIPLHADGQSDGSSDKKTPKKRGRKSKNVSAAAKTSAAIEPPSQSAQSTKDTPAAEQGESDRPPLTAKDVNQPPAKVRNNLTKANESRPSISGSENDGTSVIDPPVQPASQPIACAECSNDKPPKNNSSTTTTTTPSPTKPLLSPATKPTHSPLKTSSSTASQRYRIGLSKRTKIPSLLRKVQRDKAPPTKTGVKVKELKIKGINDGGENENENDGAEGQVDAGKWTGILRDKDGRLIEWDF